MNFFYPGDDDGSAKKLLIGGTLNEAAMGADPDQTIGDVNPDPRHSKKHCLASGVSFLPSILLFVRLNDGAIQNPEKFGTFFCCKS